MENVVIKAKKVSILSIVSLLISITAFFLYMLLAYRFWVFYFPWIISSIASIFLPIISKYNRKKYNLKGKTPEIIAFIIGAINFYFFMFYETECPNIFIIAIITVICILYGKLFSNKTYSEFRYSESVIKDKTDELDTQAPEGFQNIYEHTHDLLSERPDVPKQYHVVKSESLYQTEPIDTKTKILKAIFSAKFFLLLTVLSAVGLILLLIIISEDPYSYRINLYIVSTLICLAAFISFLITFIHFLIKNIYSSIRYKEKCFKKAEHMKYYLDKGIINAEEYENIKKDIFKKIRR